MNEILVPGVIYQNKNTRTIKLVIAVYDNYRLVYESADEYLIFWPRAVETIEAWREHFEIIE